jgi:hypothetical protein
MRFAICYRENPAHRLLSRIYQKAAAKSVTDAFRELELWCIV